MIELESAIPVVPDQLKPLLDEYALSIHEKWRSLAFYDIKHAMPEPELIETKDGRRTRIVDLTPADGPDPEAPTIALFLPHAQAWKPSMFIRAELARQMVIPEGRMLVFPNNSIGDAYYKFDCHYSLPSIASTDGSESVPEGMLRDAMERLRPLKALGSLLMGALEAKHAQKAAFMGYSLGGLLGWVVSAAGSDTVEVTHIGSFEAPSHERTPGQLRKDFSKGGLPLLRAAVSDAKLPALSEAMNVSRLAYDIGCFVLANTMDEQTRFLYRSMGRMWRSLFIPSALGQYPNMHVLQGRLNRSAVLPREAWTDTAQIVYQHMSNPNKLTERSYYGEGDRGHATGDNVVAHALMIKDALVA